jgi:hypothetical protein
MGNLPEPEVGLRTVDQAFKLHPGPDPKAAVKVSGIDQWTVRSVEGFIRKVMFDLDRPGEVTVYLVATTS